MRYFANIRTGNVHRRYNAVFMFGSKKERDEFVAEHPARKPVTRNRISSLLGGLKPFGAEYLGVSKEAVPESVLAQYPNVYRVTRCKKGSGVPSVDSGVFL